MMSYRKQNVNILRYEIRLMQKINSHFYIKKPNFSYTPTFETTLNPPNRKIEIDLMLDFNQKRLDILYT